MGGKEGETGKIEGGREIDRGEEKKRERQGHTHTEREGKLNSCYVEKLLGILLLTRLGFLLVWSRVKNVPARPECLSVTATNICCPRRGRERERERVNGKEWKKEEEEEGERMNGVSEINDVDGKSESGLVNDYRN